MIKVRFLHYVEYAFLRNRPGSDDRKSEATGKMASSAGIIELVKSQSCSKIRMSRPRGYFKALIVFALDICIFEGNRQRSAGSAALIDSAQNNGLIRLNPWRSPLCPALSPGNIFSKIFSGKIDSGFDPIDDYSYFGPVGLPEDTDSEYSTERIHSITVILSFPDRLQKALSNISINLGKDLETHSVSSISMGPSAPREATFSAITIL